MKFINQLILFTLPLLIENKGSNYKTLSINSKKAAAAAPDSNQDDNNNGNSNAIDKYDQMKKSKRYGSKKDTKKVSVKQFSAIDENNENSGDKPKKRTRRQDDKTDKKKRKSKQYKDKRTSKKKASKNDGNNDESNEIDSKTKKEIADSVDLNIVGLIKDYRKMTRCLCIKMSNKHCITTKDCIRQNKRAYTIKDEIGTHKIADIKYIKPNNSIQRRSLNKLYRRNRNNYRRKHKNHDHDDEEEEEEEDKPTKSKGRRNEKKEKKMTANKAEMEKINPSSFKEIAVITLENDEPTERNHVIISKMADYETDYSILNYNSKDDKAKQTVGNKSNQCSSTKSATFRNLICIKSDDQLNKGSKGGAVYYANEEKNIFVLGLFLGAGPKGQNENLYCDLTEFEDKINSAISGEKENQADNSEDEDEPPRRRRRNKSVSGRKGKQSRRRKPRFEEENEN